MLLNQQDDSDDDLTPPRVTLPPPSFAPSSAFSFPPPAAAPKRAFSPAKPDLSGFLPSPSDCVAAYFQKTGIHPLSSAAKKPKLDSDETDYKTAVDLRSPSPIQIANFNERCQQCCEVIQSAEGVQIGGKFFKLDLIGQGDTAKVYQLIPTSSLSSSITLPTHLETDQPLVLKLFDPSQSSNFFEAITSELTQFLLYREQGIPVPELLNLPPSNSLFDLLTAFSSYYLMPLYDTALSPADYPAIKNLAFQCATAWAKTKSAPDFKLSNLGKTSTGHLVLFDLNPVSHRDFSHVREAILTLAQKSGDLSFYVEFVLRLHLSDEALETALQ